MLLVNISHKRLCVAVQRLTWEKNRGEYLLHILERLLHSYSNSLFGAMVSQSVINGK